MSPSPTLFSKSCEYAIQALLFLASKGNERQPVLLRNISDALGIPHPFLNKVLQQLTRAEILVSHKGVSGGFSLGRRGSKITLGEVVKAVDGEQVLSECLLGFPGCADETPCPVHNQWKHAKLIILNMMSTKTVAELGKDMDGKLQYIRRMAKA